MPRRITEKKKPTVKCRHFKVANFQVIFQWECKVNDYNIFLHSNERQNQWFIAGKRMKIILDNHHKPDPFTFLMKNKRDVVGLLLLLSHSV